MQEAGSFRRVDPLVIRHLQTVDPGARPPRTMAGVEGNSAMAHEEDLPVPSFQNQVAFWFSLLSADHPGLVEQARAVADPESDPWGYLVALGELLAEVA